MAKLLYIKSSPRARSRSTHIANHFVEAYRGEHPNDTVEEIDLWHLDLPPFDGDTIDAKYAIMHGQPHSKGQLEAWHRITAMFQQFATADKYLFSIPMWNFGVPYKLKHYIDVLTQPGLAFSFSPQTGYVGLITGKPAAVIYASGGGYRLGSSSESYDLQKPYIKLWLQFIGFKNIHDIVYDNTLGDPENTKKSEAACLAEAERIAKQL